MSIQYNTYLGPFVLVHNPPLPSHKEFYACSNSKCSQYQKACASKHCPECGDKVSLLSFPDSKPLDFDHYKELNEKLVDVMEYRPAEYKDYLVLIPNVKFGPKREMHRDQNDGEGVQITSFAIPASEAVAFEEFFRKELSYLQKKFGEKAVNVHWGMINYCS